jgi:crotonobetainyl-CoA:carnitine CoA-transferase CaiB-like acyl-CoA transferase
MPAYDDIIQGSSGLTSLLPRADGRPEPRYLPTAIADKVAGLHAAQATLAALFHRARTGQGQRVEVPMFEAITAFTLLEHLGAGVFPDVQRRPLAALLRDDRPAERLRGRTAQHRVAEAEEPRASL